MNDEPAFCRTIIDMAITTTAATTISRRTISRDLTLALSPIAESREDTYI